MSLIIKTAYDDLENIKTLFREYTNMLGVDLAFQGFEEELKKLPGKYSLPNGRMFTAYYNGKLAGCIALRSFGENGCEMKRLFVRPEFRKCHIGELLVDKIIEEAKDIGYEYMVLDTLSTLTGAVNLYRKKGFKVIEAYYENPLENVLYFKLDL